MIKELKLITQADYSCLARIRLQFKRVASRLTDFPYQDERWWNMSKNKLNEYEREIGEYKT